jgi:hypothetical protein
MLVESREKTKVSSLVNSPARWLGCSSVVEHLPSMYEGLGSTQGKINSLARWGFTSKKQMLTLVSLFILGTPSCLTLYKDG